MDSDENVPEKMEDEARNDHDNEFEMYQVRPTIQEFKYKNRYETKIILVNLLKMETLRPKPGGWNKIVPIEAWRPH